jgi:hypothetical protein
LAQLRKNVFEWGCLDSLKVWNNLIVDGHNRFQICDELNLDYETQEIEFDDARRAVEDHRKDAAEVLLSNRPVSDNLRWLSLAPLLLAPRPP